MVLVNPVFESQVGENVGALGDENLAHRVPVGLNNWFTMVVKSNLAKNEVLCIMEK